MKNYVLGIAFLGLMTGNCAGSGESAPQQEVNQTTYTNVSAAELKTVAQQPNGAIILDVRTDGEVSDGMVPNAVQIDVNDAEFNTKAAELDKNTTVYVYCRSGMRSQRASEALIQLGFTDVRNVEGGYMAYQKL